MNTAARMLPMIWARLVALVVFGAFFAYQRTWWAVIFAVVMGLLTISQLVVGYRAKRAEQEELRQ